MTDAIPPMGDQKPASAPSVAPGWYPTAPSSPTLRWWDGTQWTEHLQNRQDFEPAPVSRVTPETPVYNVFIWLFTLLPLVSVIAVIPVDFSAMVEQSVRQSLANPGSRSTNVIVMGPGYLLLQLLSLVLYAALVVLAYADWKRLGSLGFARRFHWAWAFLSTVYIIGRTVIIRKESGRGMAVLWVYIGLVVVALVVSFVKVASMISVMGDLVQQYR